MASYAFAKDAKAEAVKGLDPTKTATMLGSPFSDQQLRETGSALAGSYGELKRQILNAGLLDRQPHFYLLTISCTLSLYLASFVLASLAAGLWLLPLKAALVAFATCQLAFITHDCGHRQIFARPNLNKVLGLLTGLLLGFSFNWWALKHNQHHAHPNVVGKDPDIDLGILAFSRIQGERIDGIARMLVHYQVYTFLPLLAFEGFGLKAASLQFLLKGKGRDRVLETVFVLVHHIAYSAVLITFLGFSGFLAFAVMHHILAGLYFASVFAPNHTGRLVLDDGQELEFLRHQVITSRNIRATPLLTFWYGGLNFQIEHHLFPTMPRNNLRKASLIVQPFCIEQRLDYQEAGLVESALEILRHLKRVSLELQPDR